MRFSPASPIGSSVGPACPDLLRREGWAALAARYWEAARPHLAVRPGRWDLPYHVTLYSRAGAEMEGWSRQLWALLPLIAGGGPFAGADFLREGLIAGTDPDHPSYWGTFGDCDQRMVECAVIGAALRMCPEVFWEPLDEGRRQRVADFLEQVIRHETPDNNWLFFRILVMCGLRHVGVPVDETRERATLDRIEEFAVDDRWYADGPNGRIDYYNGTGFHFYALLYSVWERERDPARAERFRDRAEQFAGSFVRWFDAQGAALPYGRSLTYRFAQGAFWSALAWAGGGPFSPGQLKGLLNRHMRWWQARPIHASDGTLTRGYGYPQDAMTESYNALGSPAWGFKIFWHLLLPGDHPYWQAGEEPLPETPGVEVQSVPRMVLSRDPAGAHALAAVAPPAHAAPFVRHFEEKYAKLAYSSQLGFSVPVAREPLAACAPDSTLLVRRAADAGAAWRPRACAAEFAHGADWVRSKWILDEQNWIVSTLRLVGGTQEREHVFHLSEEWDVVEGAFALPVEDEDPPHAPREDASEVRLTAGGWTCRLIRRAGGGRLAHLELYPGAHLIFPRARTLIREATLGPGTHTWETVVETERV